MTAILRSRSCEPAAISALDRTADAVDFGRSAGRGFAAPSQHRPRDHRLWASSLLMGTDTVAIGMIMFIGVLSTARGQTIELLAVLACALLVGALSQNLGLYAVRSEREIRHTGTTAIEIAVFVTGITAIVAATVDGPMAAAGPVAAGMAGALCIALARIACVALQRHRILSLSGRILLVGTPEAVRSMVAAAGFGGPLVTGCITVGDDDDADFGTPRVARVDPSPSADVAEDVATLIDVLAVPGRSCDRVVIIGAGLDDASIRRTLSCLEHLPVEISLAPTFSTFGEADSPLDHAACLRLRRSAMTPAELAAKRFFDIVLASLLVVALAPVFALIALAIKLESSGPALFRQRRWGWNNEPFMVLKFRTMRSNAAGRDGSIQAIRSDPRVTRVGGFLRRTSLDELPQLFNVVGGSMSLVGPRPHPEALNRRFLNIIRYYAARHRVRPGITGWAQVNGFRGETGTDANMQRRVELDLEYIRTRSFTFDLWILARTFVSVVSGTNAY